MRTFWFSLLSFLVLATLSCHRPSFKEPPKLSTRDEQVIQWIRRQINPNNPGKWLSCQEAREDLEAIRFAVHFCGLDGQRDKGVYENILLVLVKRESFFDRQSIGKHDKNKDIEKQSEGLSQIRRDNAEIKLGYKITDDRLCTDIYLNLALGLDHLYNSKTVQAYNAGTRGASLGRGANYSRIMRKAFLAMPWITKLKHGGLNEKVYGSFFAVHPGSSRIHFRTKHTRSKKHLIHK